MGGYKGEGCVDGGAAGFAEGVGVAVGGVGGGEEGVGCEEEEGEEEWCFHVVGRMGWWGFWWWVWFV